LIVFRAPILDSFQDRIRYRVVVSEYNDFAIRFFEMITHELNARLYFAQSCELAKRT
jgi:hypothetical protein